MLGELGQGRWAAAGVGVPCPGQARPLGPQLSRETVAGWEVTMNSGGLTGMCEG